MSRDLGSLILSSREGKGWSRKDLASAADVSYPYVSQIETGDRVPSLGTLRKLAEALDLPLNELASLVAPDAWLSSSSSLMSPLPQSSERGKSEPSLERVKASVRRRLEGLDPAVRIQVLAELTAEAAADL